MATVELSPSSQLAFQRESRVVSLFMLGHLLLERRVVHGEGGLVFRVAADTSAPSGPLTRLVTQALHIHNPHPHPVAFKVKTTAPKQYCVRPNSGRVEPGESVEVQGEAVTRQHSKRDTDVRCSPAAASCERAPAPRQVQGQVPGAVGVHYPR